MTDNTDKELPYETNNLDVQPYFLGENSELLIVELPYQYSLKVLFLIYL